MPKPTQEAELPMKLLCWQEEKTWLNFLITTLRLENEYKMITFTISSRSDLQTLQGICRKINKKYQIFEKYIKQPNSLFKF